MPEAVQPPATPPPDPQVRHVASGKVREIFELDAERLLLVASDRISTFDVVLRTEIPDKGRVLTGLSGFWFARTRSIVPNHLLALRPDGRCTEVRRLATRGQRRGGATTGTPGGRGRRAWGARRCPRGSSEPQSSCTSSRRSTP